MKIPLFLALSIATGAIAGIQSTPVPPVYMVLLPDNTVEKGTEWPKTQAECEARAQAIIPQGSCSIRLTFKNAGTCTDVKKPVWVLQKDADGFVSRPRFKEDGFKPGSDSEIQFLVEDFVPGPAFPDCWIQGFRIAQDEDFGPYADDAAVADATTQEPMTWPAEIMADRGSAASCEARHAACVIYPRGSEDENCTAPPAKCALAENYYQ